MEFCPDEVIEMILEEVSGSDLKSMCLTSRRYNKIISDSSKLMEKITFVLARYRRDPKEIETSTRKYSNLKIEEGNCISTIDKDLETIKKLKVSFKFVLFHNCSYSQVGYSALLEAVGPSLREIKFLNCTDAKYQHIKYGINDWCKPVNKQPVPKFDNLKLVRLYDSTLQVAQILPKNQLLELDIFREDYRFYEAEDMGIWVTCKRLREPGDLYLLISTMPTLIKLRLTMNHSFDAVDFHNRSYYKYESPFAHIPGMIYRLPRLQHLELSNIRDRQINPMLNFIGNFSTSLTTLIMKGISLPLSKFMEILRSLTLLECIRVDIFKDAEVRTVFHQNIKDIDVTFKQWNEGFINQVFSAVPNIKFLKSNVPLDTIVNLIQRGKLSRLHTTLESVRNPDDEMKEFPVYHSPQYFHDFYGEFFDSDDDDWIDNRSDISDMDLEEEEENDENDENDESDVSGSDGESSGSESENEDHSDPSQMDLESGEEGGESSASESGTTENDESGSESSESGNEDHSDTSEMDFESAEENESSDSESGTSNNSMITEDESEADGDFDL